MTAAAPLPKFTSRSCADCAPPLHVQGGEWGWQAHRFWLHGEGENPGPHPSPAGGELERPPWTAEQHAEARRRRMARRRQRRTG